VCLVGEEEYGWQTVMEVEDHGGWNRFWVRDKHLRDFIASRNAGKVFAVSDLALIIFAEADESFDHDGMSPQRTSDISRTGSLGCWRMIGTG
jgi:hypothetical protein